MWGKITSCMDFLVLFCGILRMQWIRWSCIWGQCAAQLNLPKFKEVELPDCLKFKDQSAQNKNPFSPVLDHQLNTLDIIGSLNYIHHLAWINSTCFVTEIINNVCLFQYEYALRQLYALVNLCEGGYPIDR